MIGGEAALGVIYSGEAIYTARENPDSPIDQEMVNRQVDYAIEHGINYFDTAWFYHGGKSELTAGKVLKKYPRNSYYLADKLPLRLLDTKDQVLKFFNEQLRRCQVDYFDFYLAHNINKGEWETLKKW